MRSIWIKVLDDVKVSAAKWIPCISGLGNIPNNINAIKSTQRIPLDRIGILKLPVSSEDSMYILLIMFK